MTSQPSGDRLVADQPPLKKLKVSHMSTVAKMQPLIQTTSCCSCHEENIPYLLLVGCSNSHTICHLCTRMFISSKLTMNQFPRYFPGKISSLGMLECPLCREPINGPTNLFVFEDTTLETHVCPYTELVTKDIITSLKCDQPMTLSQLHKHLIRYHNQTVKCPNCPVWLCDGEMNMEEMLQFHIMKNCTNIKCHGCDRTGNMLNMYMHSIIGRDNSCNTAKQMFDTFGRQLSECFYIFQESENMTQLAMLMMKWLVQYLYQRLIGPDVGVSVLDRQFHRIFYAFLLQIFCKIHAPLIDSDATALLTKILKQIKGAHSTEYEEGILVMTSEFAKQSQLRFDRVSRLPFCYRILVMTLSDFEFAKKIAHKYPKNITPVEQSEISKLMELYERILPDISEELPSSVLTFHLPI